MGKRAHCLTACIYLLDRVQSLLVVSGEDVTAKRYKVLMIAPTSFFADYGCHVRILEEARTHYAAEGLITADEMANYRRSLNAPGYPYA